MILYEVNVLLVPPPPPSVQQVHCTTTSCSSRPRHSHTQTNMIPEYVREAAEPFLQTIDNILSMMSLFHQGRQKKKDKNTTNHCDERQHSDDDGSLNRRRSPINTNNDTHDRTRTLSSILHQLCIPFIDFYVLCEGSETSENKQEHPLYTVPEDGGGAGVSCLWDIRPPPFTTSATDNDTASATAIHSSSPTGRESETSVFNPLYACGILAECIGWDAGRLRTAEYHKKLYAEAKKEKEKTMQEQVQTPPPQKPEQKERTTASEEEGTTNSTRNAITAPSSTTTKPAATPTPGRWMPPHKRRQLMLELEKKVEEEENEKEKEKDDEKQKQKDQDQQRADEKVADDDEKRAAEEHKEKLQGIHPYDLIIFTLLSAFTATPSSSSSVTATNNNASAKSASSSSSQRPPDELSSVAKGAADRLLPAIVNHPVLSKILADALKAVFYYGGRVEKKSNKFPSASHNSSGGGGDNTCRFDDGSDGNYVVVGAGAPETGLDTTADDNDDTMACRHQRERESVLHAFYTTALPRLITALASYINKMVDRTEGGIPAASEGGRHLKQFLTDVFFVRFPTRRFIDHHHHRRQYQQQSQSRTHSPTTVPSASAAALPSSSQQQQQCSRTMDVGSHNKGGEEEEHDDDGNNDFDWLYDDDHNKHNKYKNKKRTTTTRRFTTLFEFLIDGSFNHGLPLHRRGGAFYDDDDSLIIIKDCNHSNKSDNIDKSSSVDIAAATAATAAWRSVGGEGRAAVIGLLRNLLVLHPVSYNFAEVSSASASVVTTINSASGGAFCEENTREDVPDESKQTYEKTSSSVGGGTMMAKSYKEPTPLSAVAARIISATTLVNYPLHDGNGNDRDRAAKNNAAATTNAINAMINESASASSVVDCSSTSVPSPMPKKGTGHSNPNTLSAVCVMHRLIHSLHHVPHQQREQQHQQQQKTVLSAGTQSTSTSTSTSSWRDQLVALLAEHDPAKLPNVDLFLDHYKGKEEVFLRTLYKKFNIGVESYPNPTTQDDKSVISVSKKKANTNSTNGSSNNGTSSNGSGSNGSNSSPFGGRPLLPTENDAAGHPIVGSGTGSGTAMDGVGTMKSMDYDEYEYNNPSASWFEVMQGVFLTDYTHNDIIMTDESSSATTTIISSEKEKNGRRERVSQTVSHSEHGCSPATTTISLEETDGRERVNQKVGTSDCSPDDNDDDSGMVTQDSEDVNADAAAITAAAVTTTCAEAVEESLSRHVIPYTAQLLCRVIAAPSVAVTVQADAPSLSDASSSNSSSSSPTKTTMPTATTRTPCHSSLPPPPQSSSKWRNAIHEAVAFHRCRRSIISSCSDDDQFNANEEAFMGRPGGELEQHWGRRGAQSDCLSLLHMSLEIYRHYTQLFYFCYYWLRFVVMPSSSHQPNYSDYLPILPSARQLARGLGYVADMLMMPPPSLSLSPSSPSSAKTQTQPQSQQQLDPQTESEVSESHISSSESNATATPLDSGVGNDYGQHGATATSASGCPLQILFRELKTEEALQRHEVLSAASSEFYDIFVDFFSVKSGLAVGGAKSTAQPIVEPTAHPDLSLLHFPPDTILTGPLMALLEALSGTNGRGLGGGGDNILFHGNEGGSHHTTCANIGTHTGSSSSSSLWSYILCPPPTTSSSGFTIKIKGSHPSAMDSSSYYADTDVTAIVARFNATVPSVLRRGWSQTVAMLAGTSSPSTTSPAPNLPGAHSPTSSSNSHDVNYHHAVDLALPRLGKAVSSERRRIHRVVVNAAAAAGDRNNKNTASFLMFLHRVVLKLSPHTTPCSTDTHQLQDLIATVCHQFEQRDASNNHGSGGAGGVTDRDIDDNIIKNQNRRMLTPHVDDIDNAGERASLTASTSSSVSSSDADVVVVAAAAHSSTDAAAAASVTTTTSNETTRRRRTSITLHDLYMYLFYRHFQRTDESVLGQAVDHYCGVARALPIADAAMMGVLQRLLRSEDHSGTTDTKEEVEEREKDAEEAVEEINGRSGAFDEGVGDPLESVPLLFQKLRKLRDVQQQNHHPKPRRTAAVRHHPEIRYVGGVRQPPPAGVEEAVETEKVKEEGASGMSMAHHAASMTSAVQMQPTSSSVPSLPGQLQPAQGQPTVVTVTSLSDADVAANADSASETEPSSQQQHTQQRQIPSAVNQSQSNNEGRSNSVSSSSTNAGGSSLFDREDDNDFFFSSFESSPTESGRTRGDSVLMNTTSAEHTKERRGTSTVPVEAAPAAGLVVFAQHSFTASASSFSSTGSSISAPNDVLAVPSNSNPNATGEDKVEVSSPSAGQQQHTSGVNGGSVDLFADDW